MSEPMSETDEITTAETLIRFTRELAACQEISPETRHALVVAAGRHLLTGDVCLAVKRDV